MNNRPICVYIVEDYARATSAVLVCVALLLIIAILGRSLFRAMREARKPR